MPRLPESAKPLTIKRRLVQGILPLEGRGIDVGAGRTVPPEWRWWEHPSLRMRCLAWDREDGDAHYLKSVADGAFDWLSASHILEHLASPEIALRNWIRVVRPGGKLLISVPHRQLYEQRQRPPSRWNAAHLRFYLPFGSDGADVVGLYQWLHGFRGTFGFEIEKFVTGDWGHTNTGSGQHPNGEYCIDALLRKRFDCG